MLYWLHNWHKLLFALHVAQIMLLAGLLASARGWCAGRTRASAATQTLLPTTSKPSTPPAPVARAPEES